MKMETRIPADKHCAMKGCKLMSVWQPEVRVWGIGYPRTSEPMTMSVGLGFCDLHRDEFKLEDIGDLESILSQVAIAMRKAKPDTTTAEIYMVKALIQK